MSRRPDLEERFLLFDDDDEDAQGTPTGASGGLEGSSRDEDVGRAGYDGECGTHSEATGSDCGHGSGVSHMLEQGSTICGTSGKAGPRLHPHATAADDTGSRSPRRPSLPLLLIPDLALWVSIRAAAQTVWQCYAEEGFVYDAFSSLGAVGTGAAWALVLLVSAVAFASALVVWMRADQPFAFLVAGAVCLGMVTGTLCWSSLLVRAGSISDADGEFHVKVTSDATESTFSPYSEGVLTSGDGVSISVRIYWDSEDDVLPLGVEFDASGGFSPIDADSGGLSMFESLIGGSFSPSSIDGARWGGTLQGAFGSIRQSFTELLREHVGSGEVLLEGIVLGNRSQLSGSDLYESFKVAGIAHLLAVSGSHMSIVMALVSWAMSSAGFSRRSSIAALAIVTVSYLVLTGMQPSASRACAMALLGSMSWLAHRRKSSISALCLAIVAMLELDPSNAFSVGFELSVLGVMGLVIFMPLATSWISAVLPRKLGQKLAQPLAMTLVAHIATMPVSVPLFGMLSLIGPLANIAASPAISFFLGGGIVAMLACAISEPVGNMVLGLLCKLGDLFCWLVELAASIPHAAIACYAPSVLAWGVTIVFAILLWARWPLPTRRNLSNAAIGIAAALCAVLIISWPDDRVEIVMLDVGQGDSILVRDGDDRILIDTGQYDSMLRQALGRNGVYSLDAVVITHFDDDHCGSLGAMESMVTVGQVVVSEGSAALAETDEGSAEVLQVAEELAGEGNVVEMSCGDQIRLSDRVTLTMVWPEEAVEESGNGDSLCLLLGYDGDRDGVTDFEVLFTGDAESRELEQMVEGGLEDIDVLKVGHHGSSVALSDEALDGLDPEVALISVGEGNSYGHPSQVTLQLLDEHGVDCWRTDQDGEITLVLNPDGCSVSCANI